MSKFARSVFRKLMAPKGHTWLCFRLRTRDSLEGFICPLICPSIHYTFFEVACTQFYNSLCPLISRFFGHPQLLGLKSLCSYKKQGRTHSPSRGRVGRSGIARKCLDFVLVTHRPTDQPIDQPTDIASSRVASPRLKKVVSLSIR